MIASMHKTGVMTLLLFSGIAHAAAGIARFVRGGRY